MSSLLLEHYQILDNLNSTDCKTTFLAEDLQRGNNVIIKCLKPTQDDDLATDLRTELFRKEVSAIENLGANYSQIATIHDYFTLEDKFYLVQEYIEGKNMAQLGIISPKQCSEILLSLLDTLKYIHSKNVIHGNIKPENIVIRKQDNLPVLTDFSGIKESIGLGNFDSTMKESKMFMPPEQNTGRKVFSSDLYSLALTMIYSLTGKKSPLEIPIDPITREFNCQIIIPNINPKFKAVLTKAMKVDIGARYSTAEKMYQDLSLSSSQPEEIITVTSSSTSDSFPASSNFSSSQSSTSNHQTNSIIIMVISISIGITIASVFFALQNIRETQRKLAEIEREKQEMVKEKNKKSEIDQSQSNQEFNIFPAENDQISTSQPQESTKLNVNKAIDTIETLYYFLSNKQFDQAGDLYSYQLAAQFDANFFNQFVRVTVENLQVVSQTSSSINFIGYNTYVYPDGSIQKEKRSYTVRKIEGRYKISSSEFIKVIKFR